MNQEEIEALRRRVAELRQEHRDLDDVISRLSLDPDIDQLQLRRLKKRKLYIKDMIARLESRLIPDLDACPAANPPPGGPVARRRASEAAHLIR